MKNPMIVLMLGGCCLTPPSVAPVPVLAPPATPIGVPAIPTTPTAADSMAACLALCEHAGHCMDVGGSPRTPETADCNQACTVGHTYAMLPPQAYVCMNQPTCMIFESCVNAALAAAAAGAVGLPPSTLPPPSGPPPSAPPPTSTATVAGPGGWPTGFPIVAGGTPMVAPPAGPVRVGLMAYAGTTAADLDARYHAELAATGWTATPSEPGPEARRFTATRESTVSVSIYEEGGQAVIQTMQF